MGSDISNRDDAKPRLRISRNKFHKSVQKQRFGTCGNGAKK